MSGPVLVQSGSTEKLTAPIALNGVGATAGLLAASFIVSKQFFDPCGGYDPLIRLGENTDITGPIMYLWWARADRGSAPSR